MVHCVHFKLYAYIRFFIIRVIPPIRSKLKKIELNENLYFIFVKPVSCDNISNDDSNHLFFFIQNKFQICLKKAKVHFKPNI